MRLLSLSAFVLGCTLLTAGALAAEQSALDATAKATDAEPVNAMCPIGKEPIVPSAGTLRYNGHTIGICCPSCGKDFLAWNDERKDEFVVLAIAGKEPGQKQHTKKIKKVKQVAETAAAATDWTEPYPLTTCPVSGEALGSMGDAVVMNISGREVRFCCDACIERFEEDTTTYFRKIDKQIIKDQLPYYPTTTCVVSGEPLFEDGEDVAKNLVYGNRLVRFCCGMCRRAFKEEPDKFITSLNETVAQAQRETYPLDSCVVARGKLGSMGDPTEMVIAGRLMRFCCASCEPKVKANPTKYIAIIDEAWNEKGMFETDGE